MCFLRKPRLKLAGSEAQSKQKKQLLGMLLTHEGRMDVLWWEVHVDWIAWILNIRPVAQVLEGEALNYVVFAWAWVDQCLL